MPPQRLRDFHFLFCAVDPYSYSAVGPFKFCAVGPFKFCAVGPFSYYAIGPLWGEGKGCDKFPIFRYSLYFIPIFRYLPFFIPIFYSDNPILCRNCVEIRFLYCSYILALFFQYSDIWKYFIRYSDI